VTKRLVGGVTAGRVRLQRINMDAYSALLAEIEPQVIDTEQQYRVMMASLEALLRKGPIQRTPGETKMFKLLLVLVEDYERRVCG
jgi:hypothetical protein